MLTRRQFFQRGAASTAAIVSGAARWQRSGDDGIVVNDIHSQLNQSRVNRVVQVASVEDVARTIAAAREEGRAISIAGGRHAMGGQQFGANTILLDTTGLNRVLAFDRERGHLEVEAGIEWPELVSTLTRTQKGQPRSWGIVQKQTGADRLTIGGALAANAHGRGLRYKPIIQDVEALSLVDAAGTVRRCSRRENPELFRMVIGGYGLFGVVTSVTLRLARRQKLERVVQVLAADDLIPAFERRIAQGFLYGDFQYSTDAASGNLLRKGVFSCYRPVEDSRPMPERQKELAADDWGRLLYLGHVDKQRAFDMYANYYLSTSGQLYWSDLHQMSVYMDDYHAALDRRLGAADPATEMITEIYVPRAALAKFMDDTRRDIIENRTDVVYGTIRLIERDDESLLAWAREPWACVIFNIHAVHTREGLEQTRAAFRRLIGHAIRYNGSYFLTYHRWATRAQVEACHPRFADFLRLKRRSDPDERFQSDWYRHYRAMFA
ncbi:MAG: FAD-binding protein [Luteitalea sp.]|nr:FAD-binding protein [Luteitalea sp.]